MTTWANLACFAVGAFTVLAIQFLVGWLADRDERAVDVDFTGADIDWDGHFADWMDYEDLTKEGR